MPTPTKQTRATVPVTLSIREDALQRIAASAGSVPVADVLASRCSQFIDKLADGGLMLYREHLQTIEENIGKPVKDATTVVKATMSTAGKDEDGQLKFEGHLDPVWAPQLEDRARESGRSVNDLIREIFEMALENNWLFGFSFEGSRHTFTPPAEKFFKQRIDGNFTIEKLVAYVRSLESQANIKTPAA